MLATRFMIEFKPQLVQIYQCMLSLRTQNTRVQARLHGLVSRDPILCMALSKFSYGVGGGHGPNLGNFSCWCSVGMTQGVGNEPRDSLKVNHKGWFMGVIPFIAFQMVDLV